MSDYKVYYGIKNLNLLDTCTTIAFDTETLQLQPEKGKLRLLQLGCGIRKTIVVIDCFDLEDKDWKKIECFFDTPRFWIAHNAVFDIAWLQEHDIYFHQETRLRCTMLANRLLTNGIPGLKHGLDSVVKRHLNIELSKEQQRSDWSVLELSKEQLEYAAKDVEVLLELDQVIERKILSARLGKAEQLEAGAIPALAQMWRTGLPWNKTALDQCLSDYEYDAEQLEREFLVKLDEALPKDQKLPRDGDDDMAPFNLRAKDEGSIRLGTKKYKGFNLNSPKQLLEKFTAILGEEPVDSKGKKSASRQALRGYTADHEVIHIYLQWKKTEKRRQMVTAIQEKMAEDGFVRASYMQLGADTGRMSCIKPNNQQIPRDDSFRQCVQAPDGWSLVDADFGQMELRLAAALAEDENMISVFKKGGDLHEYTAQAMGCDRQVAKSANFGLLYGAGAEGLRNYAGGSGLTMTRDEAAKIRNNWLGTYQGIKKWQNENGEEADRTQRNDKPYIRIPVTKMRRFLPGDLNKITVRCNTPIQGAGAAILKKALWELWPLVKEAGEDTVRIAAAIHDEILLLVKDEEAEKWAAILRKTMEQAESEWLGEIPALAETSIGKTWKEVH